VQPIQLSGGTSWVKASTGLVLSKSRRYVVFNGDYVGTSECEMKKGLELLNHYGTLNVLEYLYEHPHGRKEELTDLVEDTTVHDLITHLQRTGLVNAEIELTEKGRALVQCIRELRTFLTESAFRGLQLS
jgi:hypothetical protein